MERREENKGEKKKGEKKRKKMKKKEKEKKTKNHIRFCLGIKYILMSKVLVWISMENSWSFGLGFCGKIT